MPKLIALLTLQVFRDNPDLANNELVPDGTELSRYGAMDSPLIRLESLDELAAAVVHSANHIGQKATEGLREQIETEEKVGRLLKPVFQELAVRCDCPRCRAKRANH